MLSRHIAAAVLTGVIIAAPLAQAQSQSAGGASDGARAEQGERKQHRRGKHGGVPHGRHLERALENVELPADTRAEIDQLLDSSRSTNRALRRGLRQAHREMRELMQADSPDEGAILAKAEAIGAMRTEMQKDRLLTLIRIRAQLSPEQREALTQEMASHRKGKRRGHMEHRRHGQDRGKGSAVQ